MSEFKMEINCDLGEVATLALCDQQRQIMALIDRCNISCGRHAGSLDITEATMRLAHAYSIRIGAHPGYDDPAHFGRLSLNQSFDKTLESIHRQISDFIVIASRHQITIDHVKLHGALYNDIESNPIYAQRYFALVQDILPNVSLLGLAGGELQKIIEAHRVSSSTQRISRTQNANYFIAEAFVDRSYLSDARLAPRSLQGSVHTELKAILNQAQRIINGEPVSTLDGAQSVIRATSLCLHGDRADALEIAHALKALLSKAAKK